MSHPESQILREYFERLAAVHTPHERQEIVQEALEQGIALAELERWLDWLDNHPPSPDAGPTESC